MRCQLTIQVRSHAREGGIRGPVQLQIFCSTQILLRPEKFVLIIQQKQKSCPLKRFCPETTKPGCRPVTIFVCQR